MSVILRAATTPARAARRYDALSAIYAVNALFGMTVAREAIGRAQVRPGQAVLELGVGNGRDLVALARLAGPGGRVTGIELAPGMARRAQRRFAQTRPPLPLPLPAHIIRGDARRLPLPPACCDVAFVSRVLDLLDEGDIRAVLAECRRVLRPGGRLVLVNMSKRDERRTWFERLYEMGLGGSVFLSRPVLAEPLVREAGFSAIGRAYRRSVPVGSEIVWATRPA